jgi:hypothetical protein
MVYWVVPASDFLGLSADFEPYYTAQRQEYANEQKREERRRAIREGAEAQAKVQVDSTKESVLESVKALVGFVALAKTEVNIGVRGNWVDEETYDSSIQGTVSMDYRHFQQLLELAYEGKQ